MSSSNFESQPSQKLVGEPAGSINFDSAPTGRYRLYTSQVLAIIGCVLLAGQVYTWIGYFSHPVTSAVPTGPFNASAYWYARINETLAVILTAVMLPYVVRQCHREGRLTFDAKFCIAGLLTYWCDPMVEYLQPLYFNSAYYLNVHDWTGYLPFIANPDAGSTLELPFFLIPLYTFGFLLYAMLLNLIMRKVDARFPGISMVYLWLTAFVVGAAIEIACEVSWLHYGLEAFPGAPDFLAIPVGHLKMPLFEYAGAGYVFGTFACVRYYANRRGERITERGLSNFPTAIRSVLSTIGMTAILNLLLISYSLVLVVSGLYSPPWPTIPSQILNGACDQGPGPSVTRYGPCPGSPGYKVPLMGTLAGPNPHGRN